MTTQIQRRRGTTVQHSTFTGAEGEITIDTTKDTAVVHDGATAGGHPLAKEDGSTLTNVDINSGTIDGTVIGGTTPAAVTATSLTATGTTTLAGASTTADITFGDNNKAIFGAGSDLQIYHDVGGNSIISEHGSGSLKIQGADVELSNLGGFKWLKGYTGDRLELFYNNALKLATTSTGIDVTGTVTADGLTVGATSVNQITLDHATPVNTIVLGQDNSGDFRVRSADTDKLKVHANGDISFYEDTGTTPKMVWSASSESLGIGAAPSTHTLEVWRSGGDHLLLGRSGVGTYELGVSVDNALTFEDGGTERMRIDNSGNVGIGTTSPDGRIDVSQDQNTTKFNSPHIALTATGTTDNTGFTGISYGVSTVTNYGWTAGALRSTTGNNSAFVFTQHNNSASGTERMRIDASGNLLVGKTSDSFGTVGSSYRANGSISATASANEVLDLNRLSTDGNIMRFFKDGTTVGSIAVEAGGAVIRNYWDVRSAASVGSGLGGNDGWIQPLNKSGPSDNQIDLGGASSRFDDIYATNGTIQTSDRNEKQDIAELDEAERRVAVAAKGLLRKFRWKDAVAEKGNDARIHFGIIAQDLQAAFEAEGLDAGKYAMFIHTTWTDKETGEERSRMGVRYSELLAFIIAAI